MQVESLLDEATAELGKMEFSPMLSTIEADFKIKKSVPLHTTLRIECEVLSIPFSARPQWIFPYFCHSILWRLCYLPACHARWLTGGVQSNAALQYLQEGGALLYL
jgi:hypothetical protein